MALTRYKSGITILTEDLANSWYGGLFGTPEGALLDPDDPLVSGHVHDGQREDGHAQKINLTNHVTGQLDGQNIIDGTITQDKLDPGIDLAAQDDTRIILGPPSIPVLFRTSSLVSSTNSTVAAPENSVLKDVFFKSGERISSDPEGWYDVIGSVIINNITIGAGSNLIAGDVPVGLFNPHLDIERPAFNSLVSLGEAINISARVVVASSLNPNQVQEERMTANFAATCLPGSIAPSTKGTFLGLDSPGFANFTGSSFSTTVLTVNTNTVTPGDTIRIDLPLAGIYDLQAVSGLRSSGYSDFDASPGGGTTTEIALEIASAINDPSNHFYEEIFAVPSGNTITISSKINGTLWNTASFLITQTVPNTITPVSTNMSGATDSTSTLTFASAPANLKLKSLYVFKDLFSNELDSFSMKELRVNGGANLLNGELSGMFYGGGVGSAISATTGIVESRTVVNFPAINLDILSGDVITVVISNPMDIPASLVTAGWTAVLS